MSTRNLSRAVITVAVVVIIVTAGCVGPGDETDDGPEEVSSDAPDDAPTDDGNATEGVMAPAALNERAIAATVLDRLGAYRDEIGYAELTWSQSLGVAADARNAELGSMARSKRARTQRRVTPPFDRRTVDFDEERRDIWKRFDRSNAFECGEREDDVVGEISSGRNVTGMLGGTAEENGTAANTTAVERTVGRDVFEAWRSNRVTKEELRRGYRYVGADARYEPTTGVVYVTVSLC